MRCWPHLLWGTALLALGARCTAHQQPSATAKPALNRPTETAAAEQTPEGSQPSGAARLRIDTDPMGGDTFYRIVPGQGRASDRGRFQIHATTIRARNEAAKEIQLGLSVVAPNLASLPCNWLGFVTSGKVVAGKADTFKRLLPPFGTPVVTYARMVPVAAARAFAAAPPVEFLLCKKRVTLNAADLKVFRVFLNALSSESN